MNIYICILCMYLCIHFISSLHLNYPSGNFSFRSQDKNSFHSFYFLTPFELWKISPTRNNSYSSKFVILSLEMRRLQSEHYRLIFDMLLLDQSQFSSIRLWINDTSIVIIKIKFVYLPHIVLIVLMFV